MNEDPNAMSQEPDALTTGQTHNTESSSSEGESGRSTEEPEPRPSRLRIMVRTRWAELTFGAALALYSVLAIFAHRYAYFYWDLWLDTRVQSMTVPGFRSLMVGISMLGSGWLPFTLVILTSAVLWALRYRTEAGVCAIGVGLGVLVNVGLKWLIGRPRPMEPLVRVSARALHESFPSGHVSFFVEFFGFLLFLTYVLTRRGLMRRVLYVVLGLLVALVGVSRIYLGAHWPSDVAGAYLFGGVWLLLMIETYRSIVNRESEGKS